MDVAPGELVDCPRNACGTPAENYLPGLLFCSFSSIIFGAGRGEVCRDRAKGVLAVRSDDGQKPPRPPPGTGLYFLLHLSRSGQHLKTVESFLLMSRR